MVADYEQSAVQDIAGLTGESLRKDGKHGAADRWEEFVSDKLVSEKLKAICDRCRTPSKREKELCVFKFSTDNEARSRLPLISMTRSRLPLISMTHNCTPKHSGLRSLLIDTTVKLYQPSVVLQVSCQRDKDGHCDSHGGPTAAG